MSTHDHDPRTERETTTAAEISTRLPARRPAEEDVVLDLSGLEALDVRTLSLLLTAQRVAEAEHREVWLAGLDARIWQVLNAMGLGPLFRFFPESDSPRA